MEFFCHTLFNLLIFCECATKASVGKCQPCQSTHPTSKISIAELSFVTSQTRKKNCTHKNRMILGNF